MIINSDTTYDGANFLCKYLIDKIRYNMKLKKWEKIDNGNWSEINLQRLFISNELQNHILYYLSHFTILLAESSYKNENEKERIVLQIKYLKNLHKKIKNYSSRNVLINECKVILAI